jgi:hypothetical protein
LVDGYVESGQGKRLQFSLPTRVVVEFCLNWLGCIHIQKVDQSRELIWTRIFFNWEGNWKMGVFVWLRSTLKCVGVRTVKQLSVYITVRQPPLFLGVLYASLLILLTPWLWKQACHAQTSSK